MRLLVVVLLLLIAGCATVSSKPAEYKPAAWHNPYGGNFSIYEFEEVK